MLNIPFALHSSPAAQKVLGPDPKLRLYEFSFEINTTTFRMEFFRQQVHLSEQPANGILKAWN